MVSVQVLAHSSITGRSDTATESVTVSANVTASGFRLLSLSMRRSRVVDITFDADAFRHEEGDFYTISANNLVPYTERIFGAGAKAQYASDRVVVRFESRSFKKVKVVAMEQIRFKDQYMAVSEIKLSPDSVLVYGNPALLEDIDKVFTYPINAYDVDRSIGGKVAISVPENTRLSEKEVLYSLDVSRYVEIRETLPVGVRNVPEGKTLAVFPPTVDVAFRFVFPLSGASLSSADFYVDYGDFASSIGGKCMVKAEGVPSSVISWSANPSFCRCIETELPAYD